MKQFWHKLMSKLWDTVLSGACLHEMGMSPVEAYNFFAVTQPSEVEARFMVGVTRLKNGDELAYTERD